MPLGARLAAATPNQKSSALWTSVHRLETTAVYTHVATKLLREVLSPLETLPPVETPDSV